MTFPKPLFYFHYLAFQDTHKMSSIRKQEKACWISTFPTFATSFEKQFHKP